MLFDKGSERITFAFGPVVPAPGVAIAGLPVVITEPAAGLFAVCGFERLCKYKAPPITLPINRKTRTTRAVIFIHDLDLRCMSLIDPVNRSLSDASLVCPCASGITGRIPVT